MEEACARIGFVPKVVFELDSVNSIRRLVSTGVGWSVLPEHAVTEQVEAGSLKAAKLREPRLVQHILLAPTKRRQPSSAVQAVMRLVRETARERSAPPLARGIMG